MAGLSYGKISDLELDRFLGKSQEYRPPRRRRKELVSDAGQAGGLNQNRSNVSWLQRPLSRLTPPKIEKTNGHFFKPL